MLHAFPTRNIHASRTLFHTGGGGGGGGGDLYARLRVRRDASTAEIKSRSFYALSKTLHPDVNRSDPNASTTFSLLADAYAILASPSRRAAYDRTLSPASHSPPSSPASPGPQPSYAAGRRRSTPFRGPAPSFYRNGGWGAHAAARRRAHEESTGFAARSRSRPTQGSSPSSSSRSPPQADDHHPRRHPGMGPGQYPFHHARDPAPDPHFNLDGHTRTHQREDERRRQRNRRAVDDEGIEFEPQMSLAGHFFVVATILGVTFASPFVYLQYTPFGFRQREGD
ncbi:hypothetical protein L249_1019 [Ophiocordyceps polyrhachis-furcata BCC 54312]|uniref:J domain-containing protein n=1 Tax=Ophiocordyceps polyrhachis-furcata BCC 54312 TaxID=1330021 RepID=A0A367LG16_9HYPO|nr:hypothetical protein L249_1019 [Ophiocordyceps polyrhachis-furcata BCC 54312]